MNKKIVIGSRKSRLALLQAELVKKSITGVCPELDVEIRHISTKGDEILDKPLSKIGDKGLFTEELEKSLFAGGIDLAVHSLKDLPTDLPRGLWISSFSKREEAADLLVSLKYDSLDALPKGAVVGTSSLRRRSQLLNRRDDLKVVDIRGNVETRLKKLETEGMDAIVIAAAGLIRLNNGGKCIIWGQTQNDAFPGAFLIDTEILIPAVGQGIIATESREDREDINALLNKINDKDGESAALAERALLKELEGGCQIPVGAHARVIGKELMLKAYVGSLDGKTVMRDSETGTFSDAVGIGRRLAVRMLEGGAKNIIDEIRYEK